MREEDGIDPPPAPFRAPRTSLNGAITPHRRVAFAAQSLDDLKTVKNHFGCTVNDVVLAVCAGALRRYLLDRDADLGSTGPMLVPGTKYIIGGSKKGS